MTVNTTFATMISRNLTHFERLLQAEQKQNSGQFATQLNGLYRSIDYGAQLPESNRQAATLFVNSWTYIEQHSDYRQWSKLAVRLANRFADTKSETDTFLLCRVITLLGTLLQATGDNVKAEQIFRSAERIALA
ncbi:MAG TPA: hypothetical protein ENJ56_01170, partial [Anaerolineae bacterium]|nr:hypothetical protein [Anaerolineae bacterium]